MGVRRMVRYLLGAGLALLWVLPAASQEIVPGTTYVQYRSYEPFSPNTNQYVAWASYKHASDGSPITQGDLDGVPTITDPSGAIVEADPSNPSAIVFWETSYGVGLWDPSVSMLTLLGSVFHDSGYRIALGNPLGGLLPGTYTFSVQPAGSDVPIMSFAELPTFDPVTDALVPVDTAMMQSEWVEVGGQRYLQLSWPPVPDVIDRYQVMFLNPATGKDIFYGVVPPDSGDYAADAGFVPPGWPWLRIGEDVLAQLVAVMGPLDGVNWVVQTRRYLGAYQYARSYSETIWVPFETPPPPEPPANDLFANATVVGSVPFSDAVDTRHATTDPDDVAECGGGPEVSLGETVWYSYTAPAALQVTANGYGSSYPVAINVLRGVPGDFDLVACGGQEVNFTAVGGETYYLLVGTPWWVPENGGQLMFYLNATVPLDIGLAVSPTGSFDRVSGGATISGTVSCNRPVEVYINGSVRQTVGRFHIIEGWFSQMVPCDGTAAWEAQALSMGGSFGGGSVMVQASASGFDPETGQSDFAQTTEIVRLRGR